MIRLARQSGRSPSFFLMPLAFGSLLGGMTTLIGTPPNALLIGYLAERHGLEISFARWMLLGVPVTAAILPVLKKLKIIRIFAVLGPYTPDGLPILGRVAGLNGFVMAAGHEGDGIALAPVTGEMIADLILDNESGFPLEAYRLERFDSEKGEHYEP